MVKDAGSNPVLVFELAYSITEESAIKQSGSLELEGSQSLLLSVVFYIKYLMTTKPAGLCEYLRQLCSLGIRVLTCVVGHMVSVRAAVNRNGNKRMSALEQFGHSCCCMGYNRKLLLSCSPPMLSRYGMCYFQKCLFFSPPHQHPSPNVDIFICMCV